MPIALPNNWFKYFDAHRFGSWFQPRKPRNALLRIAFGLIGLGLLAAFLVFGLFLGAAMLSVGLLLRLHQRHFRSRSPKSPVVEGEYRVERKPSLPFSR